MATNFRPTERALAQYRNAMTNLLLNPPADLQFAARSIAERMITMILHGNARSWRAAASKASKGRLIYQALRNELSGTRVGAVVAQLIRENAQLIRSLPLSLSQWSTQYIAEQQQQGRRAAEIEQELRRKLPGIAKSRIALIARTEVGKAEAAVTRARAENLGLHWYQWLTSEDQRVRPSHRVMDGLLVAWADPPSPEALVGEKNEGRYPPGGIWNCRCLSAPLVDLDEVNWPARIYSAGTIRRMKRGEFTRLVGVPLAA